jgi:hypothetical protein
MMLREYATLLAEKENNETTHWNGTTHYAGCIQAGPKHYECALQEVGRLRGTIMDLRVKLEAADNRNTAMMKMGDRLIAEREGKHYTAKDKYSAAPEERYIATVIGGGGGSEVTVGWVGLTDEEAAECWSTSAVASWKNIEAKLREKNCG